MVRESIEHEKSLDNFIQELKAEGYHVIKLGRKSPDGIATKDGKIYAVEMMGKKYRSGQGWINRYNLKNKKIEYSMFDDLLYKEFRYLKKSDTSKESGV